MIPLAKERVYECKWQKRYKIASEPNRGEWESSIGTIRTVNSAARKREGPQRQESIIRSSYPKLCHPRTSTFKIRNLNLVNDV